MKGLAHLIIFILLIQFGKIMARLLWTGYAGLALRLFVFYQIIDAVKTAKALQTGQTPPYRSGLGTMFSPGDWRTWSKELPLCGGSNCTRISVLWKIRLLVPQLQHAMACDPDRARSVALCLSGKHLRTVAIVVIAAWWARCSGDTWCSIPSR